MYFDKNPKNIYNNRLFLNTNSAEIRFKIQPKNFIEIDEGKIIYQVGDSSNSLYLLIKGQVKVKVYGKNANSSSLKFENDFFGENEVLENTLRKSAAMAIEKSLLYIISAQELNDLNKHKTIFANLIGSAATAGLTGESPLDESNTIETSEGSSSFNHSPLNPENFEERNEKLNWDNTNNEEFKDIVINEEFLKEKEVGDFTSDDETVELNDLDLENLNVVTGSSGNKQQSEQIDESENSIDTAVKINTNEKNEDSILDQIKEEIRESLTDFTTEDEIRITNSETENQKEQGLAENIPDEITAVESHSTKQQKAEQLSAKEYLQIIKKITESIYDEIVTPAELIKNYANILIGKSSSAKADRILQRIIDQSNIIIEAPRTHSDFFAEKITLKSQVFYAANVLDDILHLLANYTEFRNIKLFRKFEADASILIDKNLFYQASLQIVKFLCENISDDGSIFVAVNRTKEMLIIEFKSNGQQISDEIIKKISENFILKENPGISFAKRIVIELNGEMTVQNNRDAGPEIKVLLPIVK